MSRIKKVWIWLKESTKNPTFAAFVGAIAGAFATAFVSFFIYSVQHHDVVTYNNISSYIDALMVTPGIIEAEILSLDNPFKQIEMIAAELNEERLSFNAMRFALQQVLISTGEDKTSILSLTSDELIKKMNDVSANILTEKEKNKEIQAELEDLKSRPTAVLSAPRAKILGEEINSPLKNYMASIDGNIYYSQVFLNSFLDELLSYSDGEIRYGANAPDKINVASAKLFYDNSFNIDIYDGSSHFSMGLKDYSYGFVVRGISPGEIKVACNGDYSSMQFKIGHVDNGGTSDGTLTVLYLDKNGEYIEAKTIKLTNTMPIDEYTIPIYNTETVLIKYHIGNSLYGMANIYLVN